MNYKTFNYFVTLFVVLGIINCRQKNEGCLDLNATNIDVTADKECASCCQYPTLSIGWDTAAFPQNFRFAVANGDTCQILSWRFLVSDFRLTTSDDREIRVSDSVLFVRRADSSRQINDFGILSLGKFEFASVGTFREAGLFKKAQFRVGLSDSANLANASRMGSVAALAANSPMYLDSARGYRSQLIQMRRVIGGRVDTVNRSLGRPNSGVFAVSIGQNFTFRAGFNNALKLKINMNQLMNNLNIRDSATTVSQLAQRFSGVLSF